MFKAREKPLTKERIVRSMAVLANAIHNFEDGHKYLCVYQRLENDLAKMIEAESAFERSRRLLDQMCSGGEKTIFDNQLFLS